MYREHKLPTDSAYLENLTRCDFQAGLNWRTMGAKLLNFREAFKGFGIKTVASFGYEDIEKLMSNQGIIRKRKKISATIYNSQEFERLALEYWSFCKWLDGLEKKNNYSEGVRLLTNQFNHVGEEQYGSFYTQSEKTFAIHPMRDPSGISRLEKSRFCLNTSCLEGSLCSMRPNPSKNMLKFLRDIIL